MCYERAFIGCREQILGEGVMKGCVTDAPSSVESYSAIAPWELPAVTRLSASALGVHLDEEKRQTSSMDDRM